MCIDLLACDYNIFYVVLYLSPADGGGAVAQCTVNRCASHSHHVTEGT